MVAMELSAKQIHLVCLPTGAFYDLDSPVPWHSNDDTVIRNATATPNTSSELWQLSAMNPAKRLETLDAVQGARWRIDGSDSQGTQFHIVPLFMRNPTPNRIDVHIPSQDRHPPQLRTALGSAWAFCLRDARVATLGLSRHLVRALEYWTAEVGEDTIERQWSDAPFGSRIIVDSVRADPRQMKCKLIRDFESERQMLSLTALQSMWSFPLAAYPSTIDMSQMTLLYQVHDTISLVTLPGCLSKEKVVFKSTVNDVKYLYHELKLLLSMPGHPNIMPKPLYLVTGRDRYGGDDKLFGFILPYYPGENLANAVSCRERDGTLYLRDQMRWARQITTTLKAINASPARFYSELKADNLLLDEDDNIVFIDFEQMGNWITYSAPEIHYVEFCACLAKSHLVPEEMRSRYKDLLQSFVPEQAASHIYDNPRDGYYGAWNHLTTQEQEAAEVYSLGKTLWCIFEGCADTRNSALKAFKVDRGVEFPAFNRTPPKLRDLILRCVKGNRDWELDRVEVIRIGDKVIPRQQVRSTIGVTEEDAIAAAKMMWQRRVKEMELFLEAKLQWRAGIRTPNVRDILGFPDRPSLDEVLSELRLEENRFR